MTRVQTNLKFGVSAVAILATFAAFSPAFSGAFALREQSAYYQGMSYAGAAAGNELSSMFWNSAAAAAAPGFNTESHAALIIPDSTLEATGGAFSAVGGLNEESGDIGDGVVLPSSYANYQINEKLFLGLAINTPFGLGTKPDNTDWAGSPIAITSEVFSINVNPTVAYKLTDSLTIGVGAQLQYIDVRLTNGDNPLVPGVQGRELEGDDFGVGGTAGVIWKPIPGTQIGLGYRSAIEVNLEGDFKGVSNVAGLINRSVTADFMLPELVSLGLQQRLSDQWTAYGTVEFTNWDRVGTVPIKADVPVNNGTIDVLELNYQDGYFYSLGLEYKYNDKWTFRTGVAYEETPIIDEERNVFLPDADRLWLSLGATHKYSDRITVDLAYTHIFADDTKICRETGVSKGVPTAVPCSSAAGTELIRAEGEASVDIISASLKMKMGHVQEPLESLK
ncbi:MAG: OmpP1/FadL family transporter [Hyphomicrobiales bacterium]|nr:OmpP1/FadL family transporter [Hyphomicrobiales bacterium]